MILSRLISRTCLWVLRQSTHCVNCLVFKLNGFDYLDGFRTAGLIGVYGRAGIVTIGENVEINSAYWANPIGGGKNPVPIIGRQYHHWKFCRTLKCINY